MGRTKLSSDQVGLKVVFALAYLGILVQILVPFNLVAFLFVTLLFGILSYIRFFSSDKIEFDEDKMYLIYSDGETEINLKDIDFIGRSFFRNMGMYRIRYVYNDEKYFAQFYPQYITGALKNFKAKVKQKNPKAIIDNYLGQYL